MGTEHLGQMRAGVYLCLAEALDPAGPPQWLALAGRAWPLFTAATLAAPWSAAAHHALGSLARVPAGTPAEREARYRALFAGPGEPRIWLYESAATGGHLLGPVTWTVERLYRAAGLELPGAELPDHAALELAFLAHLAETGAAEAERGFIRRHAGRWLPAVGRALIASGDPIYGPVGELLAAWLDEAVRPARRPAAPAAPVARAPRVPVMRADDDCTLCGFCAQVCPTRALAVHESHRLTQLVLDAARCVSCGKCEPVCPAAALAMSTAAAPAAPGLAVLRESPRLACAACGQPTVSRAEQDYVTARLGPAPWLAYCPACRPSAMERAS